MNALEPLLAHFLRVRRVCPNAQAADDGVALPTVGAQIFPREIAVAVLPFRIRVQDAVGRLAHQSQIADVQDRQALLVLTARIDKGVKLFHIAHGLRSLLCDPHPDPCLQGVAKRCKQAVGQQRSLGNGQNPQAAVCNGDQYRNQFDDTLRIGCCFRIGIHAWLSFKRKPYCKPKRFSDDLAYYTQVEHNIKTI